ncbi:adenylate/guanylate cyclase domain-containing protein [Coleofasciculus sp. H7-2]|uniref:adenylate/guanylate cyclase domain-containing protein n=1 Tax=Coleofasciculus sp. H7-2 TaxID=3351545 RepID=UPI0036728E9E
METVMLKKHFRRLKSKLCLPSLFLILLLPFAVVVYQLLAEIKVGIDFAQKEQLGLDYSFPLIELLEDVVQHRAQANSRFSGDIFFSTKITAIQSQIEEDLKAIDAVEGQMGNILKTTEGWKMLKRKWQELKKQSPTLSSQESFDFHTALIADILALIAHVGDTSNLILDPELDSYYLMDTVITKLPPAIENTAIARDLGTNILERKQINSEEKAHLIVLSSLIKLPIDQVNRGMQVAFHENPNLQPQLKPSAQESFAIATVFIEILNQKIITAPSLNIKETDYFAAGMQAIDAQFKLYDSVFPSLDKLLQIRIDKLARKKIFIEAFALIVLATGIYVFVAFARNLKKREGAEKALRQAEEKYRNIYENVVNGIFQTTPEGRYLSANPSLARIYGYSSPEELIAKIADMQRQLYVEPNRRDEFISLVQKHNIITDFESQVYRKDGTVIWISENARAVYDAKGALLYYEGTVVDITYRKVAAEALRYQQEQSERLLLNVLPESIAKRLKLEQNTIADSFAEVTVLFADIVNFTELSAYKPPKELVNLLNKIFSAFDHLAEKHGLEKIKTIGDAYMVVGGLPIPREDHAEAIAQMALDMQQAIANLNDKTGESFSIRIGINTGSVVAGVIGIKKFIYDLWGDTVNTASRMESHGLPGHIQVTDSTYKLLQNRFLFKERGVIHIKGKGEMTTYLLIGKVKTEWFASVEERGERREERGERRED